MAGDITPVDFVNRFPEFIDVPTATVQSVIDEVIFYLSPYKDRNVYMILQLYLAAHIIFIQQNASGGDGSPSNPLTSASVGSVSAGYSVNSSSMSLVEGQWNSTSYGQMFYMFMKQDRYRTTPYVLI